MQQSLIPEDVYCCDADALINIERANLFRHLRKLAQRSRLKIPRSVFAEVRRGSDRIRSNLDRWNQQYEIVIQLDHTALTYLPDIELKYGPRFSIGSINYSGLWNSSSRRRSADPQVIALAKSRGWIVVTNDHSIHGACAQEDIRCYNWESLIPVLNRL